MQKIFRSCCFLMIALTFCACEKSILDKPFNEDYYEADFSQFYQDEGITNDDAFIINYAILRQRDYFGYEVKDKTYREILATAKEFSKNGIPVKQVYETAPPQDLISVKIDPPKITILEKEGNAKRKIKNLKFGCLYTNTSDKPVAINGATFIINGPFQQHLVTVAYETNCKILPGAKLFVNYVMDAKHLRTNLFFGKETKVKRLMVNDLIENLDIQVGSVAVEKNAKYYDECFIDNAVIQPFQWNSYLDLYPDGKLKMETVDGVTTINRGPNKIKPKKDKIIKYK